MPLAAKQIIIDKAFLKNQPKIIGEQFGNPVTSNLVRFNLFEDKKFNKMIIKKLERGPQKKHMFS